MARLGASVVLVAVLTTACGNVISSEFDPNAVGDAKGGDLASANGLGEGSVAHGASDVGNVTPGSACASSSAGTVAPPISLVFIVDRSGSMGGSYADAKWG